eukprot:CAMPEP_0184013258 /NCGR_PEP_ID=MMETSP0954-20121128/4909_1 /TAXON_ID=627963 /ORGANISM="Aplanochytrium sp, Strain PBS07" /LENGTH=500 /DNA_ID=CAMNT_0026293419 /DNA_START=505 /DNA_END=2007 /DNA_ORIENTATION=+
MKQETEVEKGSTESSSGCDFSVLISFDRKKEEITGRGLIISLDSKVAFDTLKASIGDFTKNIIRSQTKPENLDNKKRFWKGLREYCQKRCAVESGNWSLIVWAGYPLYQIPMNESRNQSFLYRMKTVTVDGDIATKRSTITHKQLHDMVNKQFRKFTSLVEQEYQTMKPVNAFAHQNLMESALAYNGAGLAQYRQGAAVLHPQLTHPLTRDNSQNGILLGAHHSVPHGFAMAANYGGNTASALPLAGHQFKYPGMAHVQLHPTQQLDSDFNEMVAQRTALAYQQHAATRRFSADQTAVAGTGNTSDGVLKGMQHINSVQTNSKQTLATLKQMLGSFKTKLSTSKLGESDLKLLREEVTSILEGLPVSPIQKPGLKRARSEMNGAESIETKKLATSDACWSTAEEAILAGVAMEFSFHQKEQNWEEIYLCVLSVWDKYAEKTGSPKKFNHSKNETVQQYKSIQMRPQVGNGKSLLGLFNEWQQLYNKNHELVDIPKYLQKT